ncbi:nucleoside-diphosphate kinase [Carboxylicivirga caseinilyticus]|uniref:nucleoside-diphosphate kinase n=1 Tax=Carboxylicivirga caseinilyticus TaxID=3417572 RepID=UPI003D343D9F|nr:nucleoside-diphosphate kinase [Marinilabiliaceae bacterium A049]
MAGNKTLTMIKPGAVKHRHIGAIVDMIEKAGFRIAAIKSVKLSHEDAEEFYAEHKERPFFGELVDFMSSGPIVAAILLKDNAVADFRKLIGSTDPAEAREGTIRKIFAISKSMNAIHGSDSDESAERESNFFFSRKELLEKEP